MQNMYHMQEKIVIGEGNIVILVEVNVPKVSKRAALDELKSLFTDMQERLFGKPYKPPGKPVRIICRKVEEPVQEQNYEWEVEKEPMEKIGDVASTLKSIERTVKEKFPNRQITLIAQ